ncbi:MAG TPA: metallophosphoesterase [Solirubrobacteraceae bacterium]|nr:metallophosphoesterase [Solirubrobacteraceae bacterium]
MRTLVISDLHLGLRTGTEALRRRPALDVLLARLDGVDRLVLLGDTLELRHGPARDALAIAEPIMRAIGEALGPGREVVIVPGNHDHAIGAGWLDWRGRRQAPDPLTLEQRVSPAQASWIAKRLAGFLAPADVEVAYPGLWLRDDVYAMHGHYADVHLAVPTLERLAAGAMARLVGQVPDPAVPDDYEAVLAPMYALTQASAQRRAPGRVAIGSRSAAGAWRALRGRARAGRLRGVALQLPFRLAVLLANRAGLGPLEPGLDTRDLRRGALNAIAEAIRRLRLTPAHLVFGHTHRTGRLEDDPAGEWRTAGGTLLHNSGNWIFDPLFMSRRSPGSSPYWPGGAVAVDDRAAPRLERLLIDVPAAALQAPVAAR